MKNRWLIAASAVGIHLSIGSIYAYSAWQMPLENTFGWTPTQTSLAFSVAVFCLGLSAAFLGRLIEQRGPRVACLLSAGLFSAGLIGAGLACHLESVWLFYVFFGVVSGIGMGLGYVAPVAALVRWFPDRRGLATGLVIMAFGFGGLVGAKLIDVLVPPVAEVVLPSEASAYELRGTTLDGMPQPAAYKSQRAAYERRIRDGAIEGSELDQLKSDLRVDSKGRLGLKSVLYYDKASVVSAFVGLGLIYLALMVPSALYLSLPPEGHVERFESEGKKISRPVRELTASQAVRTPAFYGLWFMLFVNIACGIALIATAKKMGYEMVHLSVAEASLFVMAIALCNGLGRLSWAGLSDTIGRPNTFVAFFAIQLFALPMLANLTGTPWAFVVVTCLVISCYGGGYACIPTYITDLFGLKALPTIFGYILTAKSVAGFAGPMLSAAVYERTNDYRLTLYLFGGLFAFALVVALWVKRETARLDAETTSVAGP